MSEAWSLFFSERRRGKEKNPELQVENGIKDQVL